MREAPHSLGVISLFSFGQRYEIILKSGAKVDFADLDTLVDCMIDEFKAAPTYDCHLFLRNTLWGEVLSVQPIDTLGRPFGRSLKRLEGEVREAITMFNLTEQWPEGLPRTRRD